MTASAQTPQSTTAALPAGVSVVDPKLTAGWQKIPNPTGNDWIGLYEYGAEDDRYLVYRYTTGTPQGTTSLTVPKGTRPGFYEMRLFSDDSYTRLAGGAGAAVLTGAHLGATGVLVAPGGTAQVSWNNVPNPTGNDWIGLFQQGATDDKKYVNYVYTNGARSGTMAYPVPAGTEPGRYEIRLFSNDSYERLAAYVLDVGTTTRVQLGLSTATLGGVVAVTWKDISAPTGNDWIGLIQRGADDDAYVTYRYTNGAASGSLTLDVPVTAPPGDYEVRLFSDDSLTRLAVAPVVLLLGEAFMYSTDSAGCPADQLTVSWFGIPGPTPRDWVALARSGSALQQYESYVYTNGQPSGSIALPVPDDTPPGAYQVRLFSDDGFNLLGAKDVQL